MTSTASTAFNLASLSGIAASLALNPEPQQLALWGIVVTSVAGIITNYVNRRADSKRLEQQRAWEREDREQYRRESLEGIRHVANLAHETKEELKSAVTTAAAALKSDIAENTALTKESAEKSATAIDAANHVTEKLEVVKSEFKTLKKIDATSTDTNDTAHRIEDQISSKP